VAAAHGGAQDRRSPTGSSGCGEAGILER
jgi:hypothetical protein